RTNHPCQLGSLIRLHRRLKRMLRFVSSCSFKELQPQTVFAMMIADQVFTANNFECWITSVNDLRHMTGSRHYKGLAFDLRTKHLPGGSQGPTARSIHAQ